MNLRALAWKCLGLFAFIAVIAWIFGIGTPGRMNFPRPFGSMAWKSEALPHDVKDGSSRCAMATDLTWRIGVTGRTEAEILSLLGKADTEKGGLPHLYMLCPSFLDIYVLELKWQDGRVSSASVRDT